MIRHSRLRFADGGLIEVKLWSVTPSSDKPHGFKYSTVDDLIADFLADVDRWRKGK